MHKSASFRQLLRRLCRPTRQPHEPSAFIGGHFHLSGARLSFQNFARTGTLYPFLMAESKKPVNCTILHNPLPRDPADAADAARPSRMGSFRKKLAGERRAETGDIPQ
jgi:hypothetical protein